MGRAREQQMLRDKLVEAVAGHGSVLLFSGEEGIGKTALARWLMAEAARQGVHSHVGRCYDQTKTPPYGPWLEAFAHCPPDLTLPPLPAALSRSDRPARVAGQDAILAEVCDFLAALSQQRPILLVLEDLHWADPASLDLLRVVARQVSDLRILLLATYRSHELIPQHPLASLLVRLAREARATQLALQPLDETAIRALVSERYGLSSQDTERLVTYLRQHAEGNPLFASELLRTLEEEGVLEPAEDHWVLRPLLRVGVPLLLQQVIAERVARLGEEAERLLTTAAVVGQVVPLALWAELAGTGEAELLGVVDRAVAAHLLEETPESAEVRFVHALVQEALYARLSPSRRRGMHRQVAEALSALPGPDPDAVAYHFQRGGDARALPWLIRAGERAQRAYAYVMAAERYAAALALLGSGNQPAERAHLLYRLARMRRYTDQRASLATLDEALQLAAATGDRTLHAYALADHGWLSCTLGDTRRGLEEMATGVAALETIPEAERLQFAAGAGIEIGQRRGSLVAWYAYVGRHEEALRLGTALVGATPPPTPAQVVDGSGYADACHGLALASAALGRPDDAYRSFADSRSAYGAAGHQLMVAETVLEEILWVTLPYRADRLDERRRLQAEAEEAWERASHVWAGHPASLAPLPILLLEGRWAEARALGDREREAPASWAGWRRRGVLALSLGSLAREQGDRPLAWSIIREDGVLGEPDATPGEAQFRFTVALQRLAATLSLDEGDLARSRAWLEAHDRWLAWAGAVQGQAEANLLWAKYRIMAGEPRPAREHAERALAQARVPRQPLVLMAVRRFLAHLDAQDRRFEDAEAHAQDALQLASECRAPFEGALALLVMAESRMLQQRAEEARALLAQVRAVCEPLQARPTLERVAALESRLAPNSGIAAAGLSPRELAVLRLVAEGLTDGEIAARLFISRRTVTTHVRNILSKLGVNSRAAAVAYAARHSLL